MLNDFHKQITDFRHELSFHSHSRPTYLCKSKHIFRKTEDNAPISIVCHWIVEILTYQNIGTNNGPKEEEEKEEGNIPSQLYE